jgi:hypothetical protein
MPTVISADSPRSRKLAPEGTPVFAALAPACRDHARNTSLIDAHPATFVPARMNALKHVDIIITNDARSLPLIRGDCHDPTASAGRHAPPIVDARNRLRRRRRPEGIPRPP